jgi:hypothetical protein
MLMEYVRRQATKNYRPPDTENPAGVGFLNGENWQESGIPKYLMNFLNAATPVIPEHN